MTAINPAGTRHHYEQGNTEGSWMGMKKRLEQEYLCQTMRGRFCYQLDKYTRYGSSGTCVTVLLDGEPALKAGFMHANAQLLRAGLLREGQHVWDIPMSARDVYDDQEFMEALRIYRNQVIAASINSENAIVRMFAVVDRRVGKRTLASLAAQLDDQPAWLQRIYLARFKAEGIRL